MVRLTLDAASPGSSLHKPWQPVIGSERLSQLLCTQEWMHLYDVTAFAVRDVDPLLAVGGPSSAAVGWVDELLAHDAESGAPLDFVSTHDSASSAIFLLQGMRSAAGRVDALSYWVASDHFEELGRPPRLLHGDFGLTVGGHAKSRYHALTLLSRLGDTELPTTVEGDGAGALVQIWASRRADHSLAILVWNHTLDHSKADGGGRLDRRVRLEVDGLRSRDTVMLTRLDRDHGDVSVLAGRLGVVDWPTATQLEHLESADTLRSEQLAGRFEDGVLVLEFDLPQPGAALIEV